MEKLKQFLKIVDDYALTTVLAFFIFLIPLYPKLPLMRVEYTYIHIRADDFFLIALAVVFLVQLIRRKIVLNTRFLLVFVLFWIAIFASFTYHVYIAKTMPYGQVALFHTLRRVQYMIVFFIAATAIRRKNDFYLLLLSLFSSFLLVVVYGFAQKFSGFPAVQTMNPAFARGMILLLTPEARISGTFSGHYDLAAYLVFLIPIVLGLHLSKNVFSFTKKEEFFIYSVGIVSALYVAFNLGVTKWELIWVTLSAPLILMFLSSENIKVRFFAFVSVCGAISLLVFTASRISFGAFLVTTPLFLLFIKKFKYAIFVIIFTLVLSTTSKDLANRFSKTFQVKQILVNQETGQVFVPQDQTSGELPAGSAYVNLKKDKPLDEETLEYRDKILRDATASGKVLSEDEKNELFASLSANLKAVTGFVPDISFATRLQVEWPRAIGAFLKNPLLGTGPFSITEATDNDYLRALGEFGLFGFLTFFYILWTLFWYVAKQIKQIDASQKYLFIGLLFGLLGLLFNATYIDVFEASKMAYVFWFVWGIAIGYLELLHSKHKTLYDVSTVKKIVATEVKKPSKKRYAKKRSKK